MASKRNVKFIQPEVPSFLKKFKERVGYKEPANINDKFSHNVENSEDKSGGESDVRQVGDEQPVIVVLKEGDMTAEEVERHKKENRSTGTAWLAIPLDFPRFAGISFFSICRCLKFSASWRRGSNNFHFVYSHLGQ